jgi:hypothetical protein
MAEMVVLIESEIEPFIEADMRRWWRHHCIKVTRGSETFFKVDTPKRYNSREGVKRLASFGVKARVALRAVALFVALFALPLKAQNFRTADQVYVLAIGHAVMPWASYRGDVTIRNETKDNVSVSVTFKPYGAQSVPIDKGDVIKLGPFQQCEFVDFLGAATSDQPQCKVLSPFNTSAFGYAIFSGCLDGADCGGHTGQPSPAMASYRAISVESYSYLFATGASIGSSVGQDMPGLPWWTFGDPLNPLRITGIRASDQFKTNLVLVNGSPYSAVVVTAKLYDGASGGLRDQRDIHLNPGEGEQIGVLDLFPKFGEWARANPTRAATNAFAEFTVSGVVPTADATAFGCSDGCPAVFAVGSMIAKGNDPTMLEATFAREITATQIASLFGPSAFATATPKVLAPGALGERAQATALAVRTQDVMHGLAVKAAAAKAQSVTTKAAAPPHKRIEKE